MSISTGWSRRNALGAVVGVGSQGPQGVQGPTGPTGPSGLTRLLAASGWYYYAAPPADYSNRYFSSVGNVYADNGVAAGYAAQVAADGIISVWKTGYYLCSCSWGNNHGAVAGSYLGARLVKNGTSRIGGTGGHEAASADNDTIYGMGGGAGNIVQLAAGDYIRAEAWSSNGYPMYVFITMMEWPY